MTEDEAGKPTIIIEPTALGGVWANAVEVTPSPHEFTLDFVRMDYALGDPPRRGIVVARVAVSPLFVLSLIEVLEAKWASYAENTTRREVWGGEEDETEGRGTGDDPAV